MTEDGAITTSLMLANGLVVSSSTSGISKISTETKRQNVTSRLKPQSHKEQPTSAFHILDSTISEVKSRNAYSDAVKGALDKHLKDLTSKKRKALADVPKPPDALTMALCMPRVLKCFRFIVCRKRLYELKRCFCVWYNTKIVMYHTFIAELQNKSATHIQALMRGFMIRLRMWRKKQREAKKMTSAVNVVNRLCRVYRLRKAIDNKIAERKLALLYPTAVLLQSIVRLFLGKRRVLYLLRKRLYSELRQWSNGHVDRLLRRPGKYIHWVV